MITAKKTIAASRVWRISRLNISSGTGQRNADWNLSALKVPDQTEDLIRNTGAGECTETLVRNNHGHYKVIRTL